MEEVIEKEDIKNDGFLCRFHKGILSISPLQQIKTQFYSTWIAVIGLLIGLYSVFVYHLYWWIGLILFAALVNTLIGQLGNYQKIKAIKSLVTLTEY